MNLSALRPGQSAVITEVGGSGALRQHLLDMGLTPHTVVTLKKFAPMGDPVQFTVRGYELTLRKAEAAKIAVGMPFAEDPPDGKAAVHYDPIPHPRFGEIGLGQTGNYHSHANPPEDLDLERPLHFALAGNQNCGKTTLFNQLTGTNQHVGNFPGVTVDRKDGRIRRHEEASVTDLPGIYSLSPYSDEEIVTRDFLLNEHPDGIINIVDATNIERNLYLTMQLMELGIPMVLALNMMDEVRANGGSIHLNALEQILGIPVVAISASKNEGVDELIEHAIHVARYQETPPRIDFCPDSTVKNDPVAAVHRCLQAVEALIAPQAEQAGIPLRFAATKVVEQDERMCRRLQLPQAKQDALEHLFEILEEDSGLDPNAALANMRFTFLERLCARTVVRPHESKEHHRSVQMDRVLTGKYTAIPVFLGIMALIFVMTFNGLGAWLSDGMGAIVDAAIAWLGEGLAAAGVNATVRSLVIDGAAQGVGSVISFLPTIVTLFFFLSVLEDTGYMARVAFVMDKPLRKIGLSGRSFVPLLLGFGCSVPAIMATRTLSSERDRRLTILLTPFMSCSAKIIIYTLMISAFVPRPYQALAMIGIYSTGILCGILFALILKKNVKGEPVPFVMELPNYRMPSAKSIARLVWDKAKGFVIKAFTIIFAAAILIWFLETFNAQLNPVENVEDSLLAWIGRWITPIFVPIGITDWRAATAILAGFTAKENVVATLSLLLDGSPSGIEALFPPLGALSFLVFVLLYTPCIATIATVRNEIGSSWIAARFALFQCAIAWIVTFFVYHVGLLFL
ncbi:MAG: ferrous iron transport protein B [Selenomonadaceae bacterium]|nr:ferrous iron transport protein B [Selenomonadaceae bacterium]